jgi:putative hydrolase of the HAD superfamily
LSRFVKAVTFDLWDTIFIDDSDEPKRAAQGLRPKSQERPYLVCEAVRRHTDIPLDTVALAYRVTDAAFRMVWHDQHYTWTVPQRLSVLFKGLGFTPPQDEIDTLVRTLEDMETIVRPSLIPGAVEAVRELRRHYRLAIVSDAIFSPGRALRELLRGENLLQYFDVFIFSDEVGFSKPDPRAFQQAASALGVDLTEIVHIGDRDHNDVKGPQALGARAILFTAARDRDKNNTSADAICERYEDLPGIIARMNGR